MLRICCFPRVPRIALGHLAVLRGTEELLNQPDQVAEVINLVSNFVLDNGEILAVCHSLDVRACLAA